MDINFDANCGRVAMRRVIRTMGWLLGLATLGLTLGVGHPAQAGGIRVGGGGIKQLGDPYYLYILKFYLNPGFEIQLNDSVTLHMLAGVRDPGSLTSAPGGSPSGPWATILTNEGSGPIPNYTPPTTVPFADVTFLNAGATVTNSGTADKYLGQFQVLTAVLMPELPSSYFVEVDWTAKLHNLKGEAVTDSGGVVLTMIPEPASLILLGAGLGLSGLWYNLRRRRVS
jgi:hypothetical protein